MKTIFFDTETTGLPRGKYPSYADNEAFMNCRLVQLAWVVVEDGEIIEENNYLIKPDGFTIKNSTVHGITNEKAMKEGFSILQVLTKFNNEFIGAKLVAHNLDFDVSVLQHEFYRLARKKLMESHFVTLTLGERFPLYCTMKSECKPGQKWKKLVNLYKELFGEEYAQHDALEDTYACMRCYYQLVEKKDINEHIKQARKELV